MIKAWFAKNDVRNQIPKTQLNSTPRDAFAAANFAWETRGDTTSNALLKLFDQKPVDLEVLKKCVQDYFVEQKLFHKTIEDLAISSALMPPKRLGERATRCWNVFCSYVSGELIRDPYEFSKRISERSKNADRVLSAHSTMAQPISSAVPPSRLNTLRTSGNGPFVKQKNQNRPRKENCCFNYNLPETSCQWRRCIYGHGCFCCGGPHPLYRCSRSEAPGMLIDIREKLRRIMNRKRR